MLSVGIVAILLVSMLTITAGTAFDPSNTREAGQDHLVQYAQPNQNVRETLVAVDAAVERTGDPVLFFADEYAKFTHEMRSPGTETVFYVRTDAVDD